MNKGRRHELKILRYKKRLRKYGWLNPITLSSPKGIDKDGHGYNFTAFRTCARPCSCHLCTFERYSRAKAKQQLHREVCLNDNI